MIRIATWNINSIRIRLNIIRQFLESYNPDILCLQETKVDQEKFPYDAVKDMGFSNVFVRGEKSYNGVAILSKVPLKPLYTHSFINEDTRHISVIISGTDIELHNFYIPAGGDEPDMATNPKFKHKIDYVQEISRWLKADRKKDDKIILLGDLNIAPYEKDVWSHKQLLKVVSHTPIEVDNFNEMKKSIELQDALRKFIPLDQSLYSWWSYRNRDWKKSNRGRRLDHILVTQPLYDSVENGLICKEARDYSLPSDHVPVICDLSIRF